MPIFSSDAVNIERAAALLRAGELVAFATETVYGLGANALDGGAVDKIYAAKGRPAFNPLIVHVECVAAARELTTDWNARAEILAQAFWPGPLTLVLRKSSAIVPAVSAGLATVALRVPAAEVAQKLLRASQVPLAAPSANRSGEISPTLAAHVIQSLGEHTFVLDGGECEIGIESTVIDISGARSVILRPGAIGKREIAALIGPVEMISDIGADKKNESEAPRASPGMLSRHYAPRAPLQLFSNLSEAHFHAVASRAAKIGVIAFTPTRLSAHREIILPREALAYARGLYASLRLLDGTNTAESSHETGADIRKNEGCDLILVELPPLEPEWAGVRDRLRRAAHSGT